VRNVTQGLTINNMNNFMLLCHQG